MTEREEILALAQRVHRLGCAGLTQEQICERIGVPLSTLKYRLSKLALTVTTGTAVVDTRTREVLPELVARGAFADPEPAEVAA